MKDKISNEQLRTSGTRQTPETFSEALEHFYEAHLVNIETIRGFLEYFWQLKIFSNFFSNTGALDALES